MIESTASIATKLPNSWQRRAWAYAQVKFTSLARFECRQCEASLRLEGNPEADLVPLKVLPALEHRFRALSKGVVQDKVSGVYSKTLGIQSSLSLRTHLDQNTGTFCILSRTARFYSLFEFPNQLCDLLVIDI